MSNASPDKREGKDGGDGAKPARKPPLVPDDDPARIVDEHRTERPVEDMGGEID